MAVQLFQGGEQPAQVTIEAVDLVYDHHVELPITSIFEHLLKLRPVAALFGRNTSICVYLDQVPALCLDKVVDVGGLGIQAVSIKLFNG